MAFFEMLVDFALGVRLRADIKGKRNEIQPWRVEFFILRELNLEVKCR